MLRISLPSVESSSVLKYQSGERVSIISAMKAQKCLQGEYPAMLATVIDVKAKEKSTEDPPNIRDSSRCATRGTFRFTSTTDWVESQFDLTITRTIYRLAAGGLQEPSNQLQ